MDRKDRVMMDVPLFIRLLELVREEVSDDALLHRMADTTIELSRGGKVLTMNEYPQIVEVLKAKGPATDSELDEIRRRAGV